MAIYFHGHWTELGNKHFTNKNGNISLGHCQDYLGTYFFLFGTFVLVLFLTK